MKKQLTKFLFLALMAGWGTNGSAANGLAAPNPCQASYTWSQSAPNIISFSGSSASANSSTVYHWSFGDGSHINGQNQIHTFNIPGTYVVCLRVTDSTKCHSLFCDTVHVTGSVICHLSVSVGSQKASCNLCTDGAAFVTSVTGGTPPFMYSWSPVSSSSSHLNHLTPGIYMVCVTDANGCNVCTSDTVKIRTSPCQANFTWTQTNPNIISFNNSSSVNTNANTGYTWHYGDGTSSTGPNPVHTFTIPGTYTVCLTIRDKSEGCEDKDDKDTVCCHSTFCDTIHVTGTVICSMTIKAKGHHTSCTSCTDGTAFAHASGGTPPYVYSWSNGATTNSAQNLAPGTYTVCATDVNHCMACAVVTITAGSKGCNAEYTLNADTTTPGKYVVTNLSGGVPPLSYTWSWGDGTPNDLSATPTHTYASPGLYQICLTITDAAGCTSSDCDVLFAARLPAWVANQQTTVNVVTPDNAVGLQIQPVLSTWNLFPNPSSGTTLITYSLSQNSDVRISVSTLEGREILQLANISHQASGNHDLTLDAGSLPQGSYLVNIRASDRSETKRLTVIR